MKFKEKRNTKDNNLVINDRITEMGLPTYWAAVDATFKYNSERRCVYIARQTVQAAAPPKHLIRGHQVLMRGQQSRRKTPCILFLTEINLHIM